MRPSDPIRSASRGNPATIKAWLKGRGAQAGYDAFVDELYRVCADPRVGLDAWMMVAECSEETGEFTSPYWMRDGNPSGIGIYASGVKSPFSIPGRPQLAAHVHLCVMLAHLGVDPATVPPVADALAVPGVQRAVAGTLAFATRDSGFTAALPQGVRTLHDLCVPFRSSITGATECVHACDDSYAEKICARGNAMDPRGADAGTGTGTTPAPRPAPGNGPAATTLARVNLRDAPWGKVVGTLDAGSTATITGPAVRGWWPVAASGQTGYVAASLVTAGARTAVAGVFGQITGGQGRISQSFGNVPSPNPCGAGCYDYVTEYLMEKGAHGGIDVGLPIGTPLYLPVAGRCVCAGTGRGTEGCAAFGSDDGGSGRVEFELGGGVRLVLGHTHKSYVAAGKDYPAGAHVADSGTAGTGGHVHVELRFPADNTGSGSIMGDPSLYFGLGASPAPAPQPQPQPGPDLAAAFGQAVLGGTTYRYDPAGVISGLWRARGDKTGAYPALLAVAERGPARYFVFANGAVAFTPADGAPAQWLGAA